MDFTPVRNSILLENTTFRKLGLFHSSGEGRVTSTRWTKSINPVILSVTHYRHRQNPLDSTIHALFKSGTPSINEHENTKDQTQRCSDVNILLINQGSKS
jgi:hypothetical protein